MQDNKSGGGETSQGIAICNVPPLSNIIPHNENICKEIVDAYRNQTRLPDNDTKMDPYSHSVYGAYLYPWEWELLNYKMDDVNNPDGRHKHYTREKVFDSLRAYARGFQFGFDNFLLHKVNTPGKLLNGPENQVQSVMDYLSGNFRGMLRETFGDGVDIFSGWYDDGVEAGYTYAAWYTILENHKLFEPYFTARVEARESTSLPSNKTAIKINAPEGKDYSAPQVAIAYAFLGVIITESNAEEILKKHTKLSSGKNLYQNRVNKISELSQLEGDKTADTKKLNNLKAAKRLVSTTKDKKALAAINDAIEAFKAKYQSHY